MDQRTPETTPNYTLKDKGFISRNQQQEFHTLLAIIVSYNFYQTFSYQISTTPYQFQLCCPFFLQCNCKCKHCIFSLLSVSFPSAVTIVLFKQNFSLRN